jgi:hypothetical protein
MKTTNVLISLFDPTERARYLVRQVSNRVRHPESDAAIEDAECWDTQPFMEKIMEAVFHFDKHELMPSLRPDPLLEACEDELLNVGVSSENTAWIVNDVYSMVIDEIATHLPNLAFNESQTNRYEFINTTDVMVSSTCYLTPTPVHPWQQEFEE